MDCNEEFLHEPISFNVSFFFSDTWLAILQCKNDGIIFEIGIRETTYALENASLITFLLYLSCKLL